jgi:hypothetical protein
MGWTEPKTWTNEPIIATDLNTHIRDNLEALKDPPFESSIIDKVANYTTASGTFTNVDTLDTIGELRLDITTHGGDLFVCFNGMVTIGTDATGVLFNISLNGTAYFADDGITGLFRSASSVGNARIPISFTVPILKADVPAGSHTIRLMWRTTGGATATLYAGAATAGADIHPTFWVREIS